jgi:hypothetical protein
MNRRNFMRKSGLLSASMMLPRFSDAADSWSEGQIQHLIPLSNHNSILLKVSFSEPQQDPSLRIGRSLINGQQRDTLGRFWSFRADGLESNQEYELTLQDSSGNRYADSWPLRTSPAIDAESETLRVLIYTCAGGPDNAQGLDGSLRFLPVSTRQKLLERAMSFSPDLAVGVGDQVYWDQNTPRNNSPEAMRNREYIWGKYGSLDEDLPIYGSANEAAITGCLDEQIASLYGSSFRSTPLILTQDDHDYFVGDVATDEEITFPPRNFTSRLGRAQQSLYFPEFLPDQNRPNYLAGSNRDGTSESYGTFRWGSLLEMLLYDCRRNVTLAGPSAVVVEPQSETWLHRRTADENSTRHLIQVPSTPMGWSAGKWAEWYPDFMQADGQLGIEVPKPYWQSGWFEQHQRILSSLASQRQRIPLMISGDLHAIGSGVIHRSEGLNFDNPIQTILSGPVGTGTAWPSASRGIGSTVPVSLQAEERASPIEKNGFTILDIDPDSINVRQFAWLPEDGLDAIDSLQPFSEFTLNRP